MTPNQLKQSPLKQKPWLLLIAGATLIVLANLQFGIGILAFLAPIPLLHYLRTTTGVRSGLLFLGALFAAWTGAVLKIASEPAIIFLAPLFSLPIALFTGAPYLVWGALHRRLSGAKGAVLFAALAVIGEWAQHAMTPFASWGAAAYTQGDNLPLLQLASLTGAAGVSGLIYLVAATAELAAAEGVRAARRPIAVVSLLYFAAIAFGEARLGIADNTPEKTIPVAAVGTDFTGGGTPLPTEGALRRLDRTLFDRTRRAARQGARLVVWNEAASVVRPEKEAAWLAAVGDLAGELSIYLAAAFVVPVQEEPLRYENKYVLFTPDGAVAHRYLKHRPVPGEPAAAGEGPLPILDTPFGRLSGAICYDYDFPRLALEHAQRDVDLAVLPSSDWRGIDPIHTEMAALRAVEGGHAVLRSTRLGLSAGIDPYGRMRGRSSYFDAGDPVLIVRLPTQGVKTVYGATGDWFIGLSALLIGWLGITAFRGKRPNLKRDDNRVRLSPDERNHSIDHAPGVGDGLQGAGGAHAGSAQNGRAFRDRSARPGRAHSAGAGRPGVEPLL